MKELIKTKPKLNRDILREVFYQILKSIYLRDEIDKFMMCGREQFQLPSIEYRPARIDSDNESDDSDYDGEPIVGTQIRSNFSLPLFLKPISLALASTMTSLDLRSSSPLLIPMLKSVDREMVKVKIFDFDGQLMEILEACVNIPNVREGVTIGLSDEDYNFASAMKSFAIPCHKLTIKKTQLNKMFTGINLNNQYLRNIRDLTIQGRFRKTPSFQKEMKEFASFLSLNFPNLENLNIIFLNKYGCQNYYWDWNDTKMANYFKVLGQDIKGYICFKILNEELEDINYTKYPDVQESDKEYYKIFPINDNLTFKMAYWGEDEESEYYGSEYNFDLSGYSS
uniref:DUF38 domain-containing protein n=1 Tax=Panagrolaimus davidi TaxID=227884 RepID=A0A914QP34_9BILA